MVLFHPRSARRSCRPGVPLPRKDADGNVIGCLSACMAGISAQDPSVNCCSGKYNSMEACHSEEVDFYKQVILSVLLAWNHLSQVGLLSRVLKPYCQNAYWYRESPCDLSTCPLMLSRLCAGPAAYDFQPNTPTVDWACPASKNAAYTITFCPDGATTKNDSTIRAGGVTFVGDHTEQGKNVTEDGKQVTKGTVAETVAKSSITSDGSTQSSTSKNETTRTKDQSSTEQTAAARPSPMNESTDESKADTSALGYSRSTVYWVAAAASLVIVAFGFLACGCLGKRRDTEVRDGSGSLRKKDRTSSDSSDTSAEDTESHESRRGSRPCQSCCKSLLLTPL